MRAWASGVIVGGAAVTLIFATVPTDLVPAVIGFMLAIAAAIVWTHRNRPM
jgi:hypothetical protein